MVDTGVQQTPTYDVYINRGSIQMNRVNCEARCAEVSPGSTDFSDVQIVRKFAR